MGKAGQTYARREGTDFVDSDHVKAHLKVLEHSLKERRVSYLWDTEFQCWRDAVKDMSHEWWRYFDVETIETVEKGLRAAFKRLEIQRDVSLRIQDQRKPWELLARARKYQPEQLERMLDWADDRRKYWPEMVGEAVRIALNPKFDLLPLVQAFGKELHRYYVHLSDCFNTTLCLKMSAQVIDALRGGGDSNELALWLHEGSVARTDADLCDQAAELCDEALKLGSVNPSLRGHVLHRRSMLHVRRGDLRSARLCLSEAAWMKRAATQKQPPEGHRHEVWSTLSMAAVVDELSGRLLHAERRQRRCLGEKRLSDRRADFVVFRLARVLRKRGRFEEAIDVAEHTYSEVKRRNLHRIAFRLATELALSSYFAKKIENGRRWLKRARRHAECCDKHFGGPGTRLNYALASMLLNRPKRVNERVDASMFESIDERMSGGFAYRNVDDARAGKTKKTQRGQSHSPSTSR